MLTTRLFALESIKPSDLISNDHVQVFLERELRKRGYQYLRKRQTKSEAKWQVGSQGFYQIRKDEIAQAVAACDFNPSIVTRTKEGLFDTRYYRTIFSSRSISFYLSRYWLMHQVKSVARGDRERGYAKWLVLHLAWEKLAQIISSGNSEQQFRYACEHKDDCITTDLHKVIDGIFKAVHKFYRLYRGKGKEKKDVPTFFKISKHEYQKFAEFWGTSKNPYRKKVGDRIQRFKDALDEVEIQ
ncbi:MAG: AIPR family protein [bacterium]